MCDSLQVNYWSFKGLGLGCVALALAGALFWLLSAPADSAEVLKKTLRSDPSPQQRLGPGRGGVDYVEESTCLQCHAEQAQAWSESHHAGAMGKASTETVLGDFGGVIYEQDGELFRFYKKQGAFRVEVTFPDGSQDEWPVLYSFGVDPLQQYLVPGEGGRLQVLGAAWDVHGKRWFDVDPQQAPARGDAFHWTGRYQSWNAMCADCHSTGLVKAYDDEADAYRTTWAAINVGCQSCHGPGSEHIAWARRSPTSRADSSENQGLVDRDRLASAQGEIDSCAPCHSRRASIAGDSPMGPALLDDYLPRVLDAGLYHTDGQILDEVYVYGSFLQSRMHQAGVRCSDCHEPHRLALRAEGNALCVRCHTEQAEPNFPTLRVGLYDSPTHHHHEAGSAGAECVACHMPETSYMVVDPRRDHGMHVPRPDLSQTMGVPNACNGCHSDQSIGWASERIREWYGPKRMYGASWAEPLWQGRSGNPEALEPLIDLSRSKGVPDIVRATALSLLPAFGPASTPALVAGLGDEDAQVRLQAVSGLSLLPNSERIDLLLPALNDPVRSVRAEAGRALADVPQSALAPSQADVLARAMRDYELGQRAQSDLPPGRMNLALFYTAQGRAEQAIREYRIAIEQDPGFVPPVANLAGLLDALGRRDEAEKVLREGLVHHSNSGELHYSLGLLLAGQGRLPEAIPELEQAARLLPERGRVHYNLGLAYQHMGKRSRALVALRKAAQVEPRTVAFHRALVIFYLQDQRLDEARNAAARWIELTPGDPEARGFLVRIDGAPRESKARAR
ncbi:MAG: tetratricopeptide repeat protein [Myxococcota bacterium]|nr:tetratricopeptide repeat protein [Myxococcota bacterium]